MEMETIYTVRTESHTEYKIGLGAIIPITVMVSLGYMSYAAFKKLLTKK